MSQKHFHVACVAVLMATVGVAADEPALPPKATLVLPVRETAKRGSESQEKSQRATQPAEYGIARRGTATVEDAYRIFVAMAQEHGRIAADVNSDELCFDDLAALLRERCIIDPEWSFGPTDCLPRDVLAYMASSYMGCRPGLLTGLCGMTRRYAHREMLYRGVMTQRSPHAVVSGSELLSVATRVARRIEPHRDITLKDSEVH